VFNSLEQLLGLLQGGEEAEEDVEEAIARTAGTKGGRKFILQKYIENPLLYRGRKFDLRVWVLLTHEGKVYLYREGYMRLAS
jgi:hypothetical protein